MASNRHKISIAPLGGGRFRVTVDGSSYEVGVPSDFIERIAWKRTPEDLIRHSFEFLLEREPKESILSKFDLPDISKYFSDYESSVAG